MGKHAMAFLTAIMLPAMALAAFAAVYSQGGPMNPSNPASPSSNPERNVGTTTTVSLDSNITTGFEWSCTLSREGVIEISGDKHVADRHDDDPYGCGYGGTQVYEFTTVGTASWSPLSNRRVGKTKFLTASTRYAKLPTG